MKVEIKKLTPAHVDEYMNFFETTPHDDNIPEHTCYCECWCSADHRFGTGIPSREERKAMAIEYVKSGQIQGYLAYVDDCIVGWCNANTKTECLNCIGWYRFMPQINELEIDVNAKVKSIYCFLVAPDMKRKGIAKQLLQYACQDAKSDGYDYVEVYPEKETTDELKHFMGFVDMYKSFGFTIHAETKQKFVMRKQLKGSRA
ncbi:GNAT family N-acetyltransferase [Clostridium saccharoperbutylacetonicum]